VGPDRDVHFTRLTFGRESHRLVDLHLLAVGRHLHRIIAGQTVGALVALLHEHDRHGILAGTDIEIHDLVDLPLLAQWGHADLPGSVRRRAGGKVLHVDLVVHVRTYQLGSVARTTHRQ